MKYSFKKAPRTRKTQPTRFPIKLPIKLNSVFVKSLLLTIVVVTFTITMSFISKKSNEKLPSTACFCEFEIADKNRQEINTLIEKEINPALKNLNITLKFDTYELKLNGKDYDFKFKSDEFFKDAAEYFKENSNQTKTDETNFTPKINYNKKKLEQEIKKIASKATIEPANYSYKRNGNILIVNSGNDGKVFNVNECLTLVVHAFTRLKNNEEIEAAYDLVAAKNKKINFKEIQKAINCSPQNATYGLNSKGQFTLTPEKDGLYLDSDQELKIADPENGTYKLNLKVTRPKVTTASIKQTLLNSTEFHDKLSQFSTEINKNKSTAGRFNIAKAAKAINNILIFPNESFSFATAIANEQRASGVGYQKAIAFNTKSPTGKTLEEGGGICQVCSTLFNAAINGNFEIKTRACHSYKVDYVRPGCDAAYSSGGKNLVFTNNRKYPIIIKSGVKGNSIYVTIHGKKLPEENFYVRFTSKETQKNAKFICAEAYQQVYQNEKAYKNGAKPIQTRTFSSRYLQMPKHTDLSAARESTQNSAQQTEPDSSSSATAPQAPASNPPAAPNSVANAPKQTAAPAASLNAPSNSTNAENQPAIQQQKQAQTSAQTSQPSITNNPSSNSAPKTSTQAPTTQQASSANSANATPTGSATAQTNPQPNKTPNNQPSTTNKAAQPNI